MNDPQELARRLAVLSPEKRALVMQRLEAASGRAAPLVPVPRGQPLPLSSAQRRLWVLSQIEGPGPTYHVPLGLRLPQQADGAQLQAALSAVVARHEILRTTYHRDADTSVVQRVHPAQPLAVRLQRERLAPAPGESPEATQRARAQALAQRPFDLTQDLPLRAWLLQAAGAKPLLLLVLHHIACDGWSMGILVRELAALEADSSGASLPALGVQYADYAAWEARQDAGAQQGLLAAWRERLAGAPVQLALPADHAPPVVATTRGATVRRRIDGAAMTALRRLARDAQATPYAVLLAVVGAVLARHAGQHEVVIGCPLANRELAQTQGLIGFFVNTLPVRLDLSGEPALRALVAQVRAGVAWALERQGVPFDRLVDLLGSARDASSTPVFQAVVSYQPADAALPRLQGQALQVEPMDTGTAKYPLTFVFDDAPDGCALALEYNRDLFAPATAGRLADQVLRVLAQALAEPDAPLLSLRWMDEDEARRLAAFEGGATPYPQLAVHEVFAALAQAGPGACAWRAAGGADHSYAQLAQQARRVAAGLQARGVGPGDRVGLALARSPQLLPAMLGVLMAGAAYVPLDPQDPPQRRDFLRQDTGMRCLLDAADVDRLLAHDGPFTPVAVSPEAPAYVMYTSGSTGQPKGVVVPHRAIVRLVCGNDFIDIGAQDLFLQLAPLAFDASTLEIWGPLLNGAALVLAPPGDLSLEQIGAVLADQGITTLWLTTGLFNLMVDERVADLSGLRQLLVGGEALSVAHVRRVRQALPGLRLVNGYGPTENTTFTACHRIDAVAADAWAIPIGRPIANTRVYIVDEAGRPVPVGVPGQLWAGGDGVALGYLNQPELTAQRFMPNPFGPGRLYKTGDRARWRDDGSIDFLGRDDDQVKLRGYRIEPGEIAARLRALDSVADAAVLVQDGPGGKELVAYVVPAAAPDASDPNFSERLLAELAAGVPGYMVPAQAVMLSALPLNRNGKIDRAALPPARRPAGSAAPTTAVEIQLVALVASLLDMASVGIDDHFFALGGNSLVATQLVSRLRAQGLELSLRQVFATPGLRQLAAAIEAHNPAAGPGLPGRQAQPAPAAALLPLAAPEPQALSFAQERLWFLHRLEPDSPFYNISVALAIDGALDEAALERALAQVVARHEVLRTVYEDAGGLPRQRVLPASQAFTLRRAGLLSSDDERDKLARAEARAPFDLSRGPVLRASLAAVGAERHVLLLTIHHIAADGWSMGVLVREVSQLYRSHCAGEPSPLAPLPQHYADYARWQRSDAVQADWLRQMAYWERQMAGYPAELSLPADRARPAQQTFAGGSMRFALDAGLSHALAALAQRVDVSLFMLLLAAFAAVLSRQSGQQDIVIGSPIAGRTRKDFEGLTGFFVNTLALRVDTSGDPAFADLLARVRQVSLDAFANQELPFERLVDRLQPERDLSRNPLFQVMFALQNTPLGRIDLPGLSVTPLDYERSAAQFDIVLDMWQGEGCLQGVLEFSTDLFDHATMARLLKQLRLHLAAIVTQPQTLLSALPLVDEADRRQLLDDFNVVRDGYPVLRTLHGLFEEQVAAGPGRIAVEHNGRRLDYATLNRQANRIAHTLRARGVGRNDFVALHLERGIGLLAAMLGVLKAGAAFVPIDPAYPAQRVAHMLGDSQARVLIAPAGSHADALDPADCAGAPDHDPAPCNVPGDRAYMLYTSGSTGLPKGAILRHDGKINHIFGQVEALQLHRDTVFLQTAPSSSDISVWQFLAAPLIGGRTVIVDTHTVLDAPAVWETVVASGATLMELVPVALSGLLEHAGALSAAERARCALACAMVTGEAVPVALANRWLQLFAQVPLANAYGPTEACDDICQHLMTEPLPAQARSVPIGRPLPNLVLYVLGPNLELLPVGVPGEICVSGIGVGEGYWNNPERTALQFVPNPYAPGGRGAVLYRTGDLGFWRPDGVLECLSRADEQVKLRGYRIELGEIESLLGRHPAVRDAVVVLREDTPGDARLVAYAVANPAALDVATEVERLRAEQVALWQDLHDNEYRQVLDHGDPAFNVIGWDSSYTGQPLPIEQMREYVGTTVARVRALAPARVLEIGCGSGLILFALADAVQSYVATDLSGTAIERLQALCADPAMRQRLPGLAGARLRACAAHTLDWLPAGAVDTVIFPSVLQYFPSLGYLEEVLSAVLRVIEPDGAIVFGDVRSLPLLAHFHLSMAAFTAAPEDAMEEVAAQAQALSEQEQELSLAPACFAALLQRLGVDADVEVLSKRGRGSNEMTRFRCDVVVRLGQRARPRRALAWQCWPQASSAAVALLSLEAALARGEPALGWTDIPNLRLQETVVLQAQMALRDPPGAQRRAVVTLAQAREAVQAASAGVEPEDLVALGERLGYEVVLSMASGSPDGRLDAAFLRHDGPAAGCAPDFPQARLDPGARLANDPLRERLARVFAPRLREHLRLQLPHYMVPSDVVLLERMPTNPAGKVDRQALPVPARSSWLDRSYIAPATPEEQAIAVIWCEVLGRERCGRTDNFFSLGGHSLKAIQVVSRIRLQLGCELPLRALFAHPVLSELAAQVTGQRNGAALAVEAVPVRIADAAWYPLSPAQRRLWILAQIEDGSVAYNMPAALALNGPLDPAALARALDAVVARHESLRTVFVPVDGQPRQVVRPALQLPLQLRDLSGQPDPVQAARSAALADAGQALDLVQGPLLRVTLLRLAPEHHVLLFNVHHIVADDWSLGVIVRDLMRAYAGAVLEPLALQYRDVATWQESRLAGEGGAAGRAFWLNALGGELAPLELPTDRPRPAVKTYRGRVHRLRVAAPCVSLLQSLAQGRGTTLFAALLAGVKLVLHRHSGARDLRVAVPVAGRAHPALEGQVGFFVNTVVVRSTLDPAQAAGDWVGAVGDGLAAAMEHQDYPFDRLVDDLSLRRDPSRMPVCDVTVVMADTGRDELALPGIAVRPLLDDYDASKYDLHFVFEPAGQALALSLVYNPDLFDASRIERLGGHLLALLDALGGMAQAPLSALPMLAPAEQAALLAAGAARTRFAPRTLTQAFADAVAAHPDRVAVSDAAASISYAQLQQRALALAVLLRERGVRRGDLVALLAERDLHAVVGLLAILMAGAAYLPLDPAHPDERIAFILGDAGVSLVLTAPGLVHRLGEPAPPWLALGVAGPVAASHAPLPEPQPQDVAYVIYTSGSTGQPKGVRVSHANVTRLFAATAADFSFAADDVWSVFHSLAFDFSVWEIWGALLHGARAAIVPRETARLPDAFAAFLAQQGVTMLSQTPSAWAALVAAQAGAGWPLRHRLRAVVFGGEALDPQMLRPWVAQYGDAAPALFNMYGITETTVHVTLRRLRAADLAQRSLIGRPLADLSLFLLDEAGTVVPVGVTGEIHVGGDGVALGYLQRPELTAQRFITHALAGPGGRLYRSGDLARWGADGELEYLGRRDHQVKLRGYRMELGEIEAALLAQPGIDQALVQVMAVGAGQQLVAFVRGQADLVALRAALLRQLPDYMVPAHLVVLAQFPLTENGKVDRARLALPALADAAPAAPLDPLQQAIADVLGEVLGRSSPEVDANFFDLGADSLLLIRVHVALEARLARKFSLVSLYRHPTVRSLADALRDGASQQATAALQAAADDATQRAARRRAGRPRLPDPGRP